MAKNLEIQKECLPLHSQSRMIATTSRSGAVVARWAHNPKVVSSSLASATIQRLFLSKRQPFLFSMRSLPSSSPSSRRRTECSFFANFVAKKKPFGGPPGYQILIFFCMRIYILCAAKKKIRYARLLRKNKGTWVKISLPVPINFVACRFSRRCPWFFTPMAMFFSTPTAAVRRDEPRTPNSLWHSG